MSHLIGLNPVVFICIENRSLADSKSPPGVTNSDIVQLKNHAKSRERVGAECLSTRILYCPVSRMPRRDNR